jgi:hypothetical protein
MEGDFLLFSEVGATGKGKGWGEARKVQECKTQEGYRGSFMVFCKCWPSANCGYVRSLSPALSFST